MVQWSGDKDKGDDTDNDSDVEGGGAAALPYMSAVQHGRRER